MVMAVKSRNLIFLNGFIKLKQVNLIDIQECPLSNCNFPCAVFSIHCFLSFVYSFIFCNHFIGVSVALDPGPIPGTLGFMPDYILHQVTAGHNEQTHSHSFSHLEAI